MMGGRPDFVLSATEFDLLCGDFGLGRSPFPLVVPSVGATFEERSGLTDSVYRDLSDRGLASGGRLDADLEALLRLLFRPEVSVDVVGHHEWSIRAMACADKRTAVLGEVGGDQVWLTGIRPAHLATAITSVLPAADPGPGRSVSVRDEVLAKAVYAEDDMDDPFGGDLDDRTSLVRAGMPAQDAETLTELANRRVAGGQFGVSRGEWRSPTLVNWFDTCEGRYLMVSDDSWISIVPTDHARLESRVERVLASVSTMD